MTHSIYSRQQLQTLNLKQLKEIAESLGVTSPDKRSKYWTAEAIACHCERIIQPVASTQPIKAVELITDQAIADTAEAICDDLGIEVVELGIESDLAIPDGVDAYHAKLGGRVILEVYRYKGGYVCRRNNGQVYGDPYSAIVNGYELYNAGAVLLARATIDRDREIESMTFTDNEKAIFKGARDNNFENCFEEYCPGYLNNAWVFAVIDASGLDPKVARGAIASLVKKGMVNISDWEGKGRADDMVFSLTAEGVKAGNLALMPEYV